MALKQLIAVGCSVAGVAMATVPAVLVVAPPDRAVSPLGAGLVFVVYGSVMILTLQRNSSSWKPLVRATPARVRFARMVLLVTVVAVVGMFAYAGIARMFDDVQSARSVFMPMLVSFAFLNGAYVSLHWLLRPENIFGRDEAPAILRNPIGLVILWVMDKAGLVNLDDYRE